jgi:hypothetical protein
LLESGDNSDKQRINLVMAGIFTPISEHSLFFLQFIGVTAVMRSWPHEFVSEFTKLYRTLPCLYDVESKQHSNKQLRNSAYSKPVKEMQAVDRTTTKDTVVKKINNMRSSYRKELKKVI